jgi:hypothetical protein
MVNLTIEWQAVFKYAAAVAKAMCAKNPNLTYPQAMKRAWKDPRVMAKRKDYEKKKALKVKRKKVVKSTKKTTQKVSTLSKVKSIKK